MRKEEERDEYDMRQIKIEDEDDEEEDDEDDEEEDDEEVGFINDVCSIELSVKE